MARAFVTLAVREWGLPEPCAETAELVTSELVTNAVKQTGRADGPPTPGPTEQVAVISVWVHVVGVVLRIEVWDNDTTPPQKREQRPDAENGRGLFLVEALSKRWGAYTPNVGGKVVWAEVGFEQTPNHNVTLSVETAPLMKRDRQPTSNAPNQGARADVALLERVLLGLRRLPPKVWAAD